MRTEAMKAAEREALRLEYELALRDTRARCAEDFRFFVRVVQPLYKMTWFHDLVARELQDLADGHNDRLSLNCPPGHGKSQLVSRLFPAWVLARDPDFHILAASCTQELASHNNRQVQQIMSLPTYQEVFADVRLPSSNARGTTGGKLRNSDVFEVLGRQGSYRAAGVGGLPSGIGANGLIADDLIKNAEEAESAVTRANLLDFWDSTFTTRLRGGTGWIVLIMTRWREDDINGVLLERAANGQGDAYRSIVLPAIRDVDDFAERPYDVRGLGEPLCPELGWTKEWAEAKKKSTPASMWDGLYQQRPSVRGGGILKTSAFKFWYHEGREPPPYKFRDASGIDRPIPQKPLPKDLKRWLSSWDFAFKNTEDADFVAGSVWGTGASEAPAESFWVDLFHDKADINQSCAAVEKVRADWPQVREHLIEDKANGTAVEGLLRQKIPGLVLVNPAGGKVARAQAASVNLEAGNIYLPHPSIAPWVGKVLAELAAFPKGRKDDIVDSFSQAVNRIYGSRAWKVY